MDSSMRSLLLASLVVLVACRGGMTADLTVKGEIDQKPVDMKIQLTSGGGAVENATLEDSAAIQLALIGGQQAYSSISVKTCPTDPCPDVAELILRTPPPVIYAGRWRLPEGSMLKLNRDLTPLTGVNLGDDREPYELDFDEPEFSGSGKVTMIQTAAVISPEGAKAQVTGSVELEYQCHIQSSYFRHCGEAKKDDGSRTRSAAPTWRTPARGRWWSPTKRRRSGTTARCSSESSRSTVARRKASSTEGRRRCFATPDARVSRRTGASGRCTSSPTGGSTSSPSPASPRATAPGRPATPIADSRALHRPGAAPCPVDLRQLACAEELDADPRVAAGAELFQRQGLAELRSLLEAAHDEGVVGALAGLSLGATDVDPQLERRRILGVVQRAGAKRVVIATLDGDVPLLRHQTVDVDGHRLLVRAPHAAITVDWLDLGRVREPGEGAGGLHLHLHPMGQMRLPAEPASKDRLAHGTTLEIQVLRGFQCPSSGPNSQAATPVVLS